MSVYTQESKYVKKLAESPSYTDYLGKISNKIDHTLHNYYTMTNLST